VGFSPTAKILDYAKEPSISVLGGIDDIRVAFATSHMLLAPIRSGKGTRYKVLEAMITGTPVVATSLAVEGLDLSNGSEVLIADTVGDLATAAVKLLKAPNLQKQLGSAGQAVVRQGYSWDTIAKELDHVYKEFKK
jgi:glycosyltransferase involved in cell wall biosynthesis